MYDKKVISVTSHALDPPVTNCHTFSDSLPLERDVLYGLPLSDSSTLIDQHPIDWQKWPRPQGRPSPMMYFPSISNFSPLIRIFHSLGKFSAKCIFHPPRFLMIFLVIHSEFVNSHYFSKIDTFSPNFGKCIIHPIYFSKCPPDFVEFICFYTVYVLFASPTLTIMHDVMHVGLLAKPD